MVMMMHLAKIFGLLKILGLKLGVIKVMSNLLKLMIKAQDYVVFYLLLLIQLLDKYYNNRTFYVFETLKNVDNPDQRIAEDIKSFTKTSLDLCLRASTQNQGRRQIQIC